MGQAFQIDHAVLCGPNGPDNFIKLDLKSHAVTILAVLNDEHHEKGANGCAGVDDHLPSGRIIEKRSARGPGQNRNRSKANMVELPAHLEITAAKVAKDFSKLSGPILSSSRLGRRKRRSSPKVPCN